MDAKDTVESRKVQSLKSKLFHLCLLEQQSTGSSSVPYVPRDSSPRKYNELNYQWNTRKGVIQPLGYYIPKETPDVQNAIFCGRRLGIRVVPKGGGHSMEKYSFGDSGSVIIDLRNLSSIHVDSVQKTAVVGAGTLMGPLAWALWINGGFGIGGGLCGTVGVAGYTMGGAYGFWGKRFGMAADRVLEMEMVDADSHVHVVNAAKNKDLFWALLGAGGGNFEIVTSFKFKLVHFEPFRVTYIVNHYTPDMFLQVFTEWQTFNYAERKNGLYPRLTVGDALITLEIVDVDLSAAQVQHLKESFPSPPPNLKDSASLSTISYLELVARVNSEPILKHPSELGRINRMDNSRVSIRTKSYYSSKVLSSSEIESLRVIFNIMPDQANMTVIFYPYGEAVNRIPPNATAFVHRNALFDALILPTTLIGETEGTKTKVINWIKQFDGVARKILDNGESYQNHIDGELKSSSLYMARYYGPNSERLM